MEDGTPQEIARFEQVTDLPIHAAVALDISASMEKSLDKARAGGAAVLPADHHAQGPRRGGHLQRPART